MLHNSSKLQNCITGSLQIPNTPLEIQIHNKVPIIRDIRFILLRESPKLGNAPSLLKKLLQPRRGEPPTELNNLNGHGQAATPQIVNELGLVDDDDELLAGALDHLFSKEGAAAALDEVEEGIDLVGAVDGEIDGGVGVEIGEGDAEGEGLVVGFGGGGDSDDVFEFSLAEELADAVDGVLGSGAGAEAEDHAGLDVLDGLVGGDFLEVVLGEDDGGGGGGVEEAGVHGGFLGGDEMGVGNGHVNVNGCSKKVETCHALRFKLNGIKTREKIGLEKREWGLFG
ncbi:hypothetical protein JHK82_056235 [Glycine max]|nr:hypothetical protein JHK87_056326 [Glycine soja]KAG5077540.1 hypothetical protein JHK82_056235 [Glycine max]